jgi:hypothetical protein
LEHVSVKPPVLRNFVKKIKLSNQSFGNILQRIATLTMRMQHAHTYTHTHIHASKTTTAAATTTTTNNNNNMD